MTISALRHLLNGGNPAQADYSATHAFSEGVGILARHAPHDEYWFGEEICLFGNVAKIAPFITRADAERLAVLGWFIDDEHRGDGEGYFALYS